MTVNVYQNTRHRILDHLRSRDSSFGIATSNELDGRGSICVGGNFFLLISVHPDVWRNQPLVQWVPRGLSWGIKRLWRKANNSPPSNYLGREWWSCTSTPPHVFGKKLTFLLYRIIYSVYYFCQEQVCNASNGRASEREQKTRKALSPTNVLQTGLQHPLLSVLQTEVYLSFHFSPRPG
jgi:hypothetical protein